MLLSKGDVVYAVCRDKAKCKIVLGDSDKLHVVEVQMKDYARLAEIIEHADVFVNLAWDGTGHDGRNNKEIQQQNIANSKIAINQAILMGCQLFVEAGSQAEYGTQTELITENSECRPFSEYGKAKLEVCRYGCEVAQSGKIKYMHLRIFSLFGEDDHPWTLVMSCIDKMLHNNPIDLSSCTQNWNFLYVDDAARLIESLVTHALSESTFRNEIFHIASRDTRQLREFVLLIKSICQSSSVLNFGVITPENLVSLTPDVGKTEAIVGIVDTVSFEDVIKRIVSKYESEK
jgi:nucleoside-diphosphate-sugar epimerase